MLIKLLYLPVFKIIPLTGYIQRRTDPDTFIVSQGIVTIAEPTYTIVGDMDAKVRACGIGLFMAHFELGTEQGDKECRAVESYELPVD